MFNQLVSALETKIRGNFAKVWLSVSTCGPTGRRDHDGTPRGGGPRRGRGVVQVETCVESARFHQRLKLKYDKLLSSVAFDFNVRPYAADPLLEAERPLTSLNGYSAAAVAGDTLCEPVIGANG
jgi:hypothetical protein